MRATPRRCRCTVLSEAKAPPLPAGPSVGALYVGFHALVWMIFPNDTVPSSAEIVSCILAPNGQHKAVMFFLGGPGFAPGSHEYVGVIRRFGEYRTARLVLTAWDEIERGGVPEVSPPIILTTPTQAPRISPIDPARLPDAAWARPAAGLGTDAATIQLAALLRALPGPTPVSRVRLAALYALEPRYLTRRLSGVDRATWCRLVGPSAELLTGVNVVAVAPRIDNKGVRHIRRTSTQHHGQARARASDGPDCQIRSHRQFKEPKRRGGGQERNV
jgi:hypothetical protein